MKNRSRLRSDRYLNIPGLLRQTGISESAMIFPVVFVNFILSDVNGFELLPLILLAK